MDEAQFKNRIEQIHRDLDQYNYYELLNLTQEAQIEDIRSAFHRMALSMHPDQFHNHADSDLKEKVYAIYKRIAEGYHVLMEPRTRREYDQKLASGELRLKTSDRKKEGPLHPEDAISHPQAKKFFKLGLTSERNNDFKAAKMNYQLALNLIGEHPVISERLEQLVSKK